MKNFDDMMAELRVEYVHSIPQKISDIESHLVARDREILRDDFHKLKGTGKTYGIPEVSELGERVEKLCLKTETVLEKFIPLAIKVLRAIHEARLKNSVCEMKSNADFLKILSMH